MASSTRDTPLIDAVAMWQGDPREMKRAAVLMTPVMEELSWGPAAAFITLMKHMEDDSSELPIGTVLWHVAPVNANVGGYIEPLLATSKSRSAAEAVGHRKFARSGYTVHKIIIDSDNIRGLDVHAISTDAHYAHEQEVLVKLHGCKIKPVRGMANEWKLKTKAVLE